MLCFVLASLLSWLIDLATLRVRSDRAKDLEILLLRRQLAILQRTQARPSRWERLVCWPEWPSPSGAGLEPTYGQGISL